jgi:Dockerin type I domain
VPADDPDCDGFTSSVEIFVGTDPTRACGPNAWPPDINNDQNVNLSDVFKFVPVLNTADNAPGSSTRFDLNTDGYINLADVFTIVPFLNLSCVP